MILEPIKPAIVIDGRVYYPTGHEWLVFYAAHGCAWAEEALREVREDRDDTPPTKTLDASQADA